MRTLIAVLMVICSMSAARGQEADLTKLPNAELVARLASKNAEPPKWKYEEEPAAPPRGYSRQAQDEVYAAINELLRRDESCLGALIGGLEDQRYSVSEDYYGNGFFSNHVGQICYWILQYKLEPKLGISWNPDLPSYFRKVIDADPKEMSGWYEKRKDRTLAELQVEACTWFLKQPQPEDVSDESWSKVKTAVQARLDEVKSTNKPYQPKPYKPRKRW